ncbi:hypothetical protein GCM10023341_17310 [Ornithinimicrobium tianjinense]
MEVHEAGEQDQPVGVEALGALRGLLCGVGAEHGDASVHQEDVLHAPAEDVRPGDQEAGGLGGWAHWSFPSPARRW